jgi:hypothetical protein
MVESEWITDNIGRFCLADCKKLAIVDESLDKKGQPSSKYGGCHQRLGDRHTYGYAAFSSPDVPMNVCLACKRIVPAFREQGSILPDMNGRLEEFSRLNCSLR